YLRTRRHCRCGFAGVLLTVGDYWISQHADLLDLTLHDIARFEVERFRIATEGRNARNGACGQHVSSGVAHGRVVSDDFRNGHGHLAGVRLLTHLAVDSQLHGELVGAWDFISGYDVRTERTKGVDPFTEAEHAGLHFHALNVASGDVVENYIATDILGSPLIS